MKSTQGLAWCLAVAVVVLFATGECGARNYNPYGSRNLSAGHRKYGDRLLYYTRETANGEYMRVVSKDVVYPPTIRGVNTSITYFHVMDMYNNGSGGYAFHTSGGIRFGNVGFHLKSKRSYGYDFNITIYGYTNQTHY